MSKKQFNVGERTPLAECPGCKEPKPETSFLCKNGVLHNKCRSCRDASVAHLFAYTSRRRKIEDMLQNKKAEELNFYYHRGIKVEKLTDRQASVLEYIKEHLLEFQSTPAAPAIADHFGWHFVNNAVGHLEALIKKGFIEKAGSEGRIQGIRLIGYELSLTKINTEE